MRPSAGMNCVKKVRAHSDPGGGGGGGGGGSNVASKVVCTGGKDSLIERVDI